LGCYNPRYLNPRLDAFVGAGVLPVMVDALSNHDTLSDFTPAEFLERLPVEHRSDELCGLLAKKIINNLQ
jgi:hypothetical protein